MEIYRVFIILCVSPFSSVFLCISIDMSIILSETEAMALLQKALTYSKANECEVNLQGEEWSNIRYALNKVSTCGSKVYKTLSVQSAFGTKVGVATIDEFDDASLEKVVRRSEELAQLAPENPE